MIQTIVKVSGMACSMCEAHINDTIRGTFSVEKVSSSHSKGETVILSKEPLDENLLRAAIEATGYTAGEIKTEIYEKKVGNYKIELNSWNNKLFVGKENEGNTEVISIPTEIIKSIININTITPIQFEEENNE